MPLDPLVFASIANGFFCFLNIHTINLTYHDGLNLLLINNRSNSPLLHNHFFRLVRHSTIIMPMTNVIHLETITASPRYVFLTYVAK